jgi:hypothetical protein
VALVTKSSRFQLPRSLYHWRVPPGAVQSIILTVQLLCVTPTAPVCDPLPHGHILSGKAEADGQHIRDRGCTGGACIACNIGWRSTQLAFPDNTKGLTPVYIYNCAILEHMHGPTLEICAE